MQTILVTGGAGFIGSALVRMLVAEGTKRVINVDCLTYAGNLDSLESVAHSECYVFAKADVADAQAIRALLATHEPDAIVHLAAESHVDRSIDGPSRFVQTNVVGTFAMLDAALDYWRGLPEDRRQAFRFVHVSTDEVFGSLGASGRFSESTAYDPSSPYSATKAGSDHLARAWHRTYGLPVLVTNCSNNYGPFQFPEKLIPLSIQSALAGRRIAVYGRGDNVRDWLFVDDHCRALLSVLRRGKAGETYAVGGDSERRNIDVVEQICDLVDEMAPDQELRRRRDLIAFVADRPGHDSRYAIDAGRIRRELGWAPLRTFERGLRETVQWYLANQQWCARVQSGAYRGERLGINGPRDQRSRSGSGVSGS